MWGKTTPPYVRVNDPQPIAIRETFETAGGPNCVVALRFKQEMIEVKLMFLKLRPPMKENWLKYCPYYLWSPVLNPIWIRIYILHIKERL